MTIKELSPTYGSGTLDPQEAQEESQKPLSLKDLANRQQAAMSKLTETTSAFDALLEETITAVDERVSQSQALAEEAKIQAAEKAAAVLSEAEARAQEIISGADREGRTQSETAMTKVGELIEAARSSAGRVATPDSEQVSSLTGEIWTALEASIEQSLQSVLMDLENLEQRSIVAKVPQNAQGAPVEPGSEAADSERNGEWEIPAEGMDGGADDGPLEPGVYVGTVNLVILLKKASDKRIIHVTPEQICRQIKNTTGGSVLKSGIQGKDYFIAVNFETPIVLDQALAGVAEWEDFKDQSDKVKEYQQRAWSVDQGPEDAERILVTL